MASDGRGQLLSDWLDVRASREFHPGNGRLLVFIDIQNAYARDNIAGFDIEIDEDAGTLVAMPEFWAGFLPSAGISYEF